MNTEIFLIFIIRLVDLFFCNFFSSRFIIVWPSPRHVYARMRWPSLCKHVSNGLVLATTFTFCDGLPHANMLAWARPTSTDVT